MACRYAGIDWAADKHDVLVADEAGDEVLAATRRARRRRRPGCRRPRIGQMENRRLPAGVQQAPTRRVLPARGQQPPLAPLGPESLRPSPPARTRAPPRDPHPRPRLVPRRMAMLAQPHPIRPRATLRPSTTHHGHHPNPVGPRARPPRDPADGRRHCHPTGGRQAEREALDRPPPSATPTRRLTQDVFGDQRAGRTAGPKLRQTGGGCATFHAFRPARRERYR
jgi:hypothetical protein